MVKKMLKPVDRAYLAGIVDGEGSIMLIHVKPKPGVRKWENWNLVISISNTDKRLIDYLVKNFPEGHVFTVEGTGNNRTHYQWKVSSKKALRLLRNVYPYLKLKQKQADVALAMIKTHKLVGRAGHPLETVEYRRYLVQEMAALNRRGRDGTQKEKEYRTQSKIGFGGQVQEIDEAIEGPKGCPQSQGSGSVHRKKKVRET
jgi:hypothetical protein